MAKGISGGALPLAATAVTEEIYQSFLAPYNQFKAFFHGHSYTGNPIACAAANASLDLFESNQVIKSLAIKEDLLHKRLNALLKLKSVLFVRGRGLMVGVEIGKNKATLENYKIEERIAHRICMACIEKGLVLRPLGHVIPIIPPLSIHLHEIDFLFNVLEQAIREITE
jgi:adenosylmethionine-8-amino-7-oxononanoate aminotransferase